MMCKYEFAYFYCQKNIFAFKQLPFKLLNQQTFETTVKGANDCERLYKNIHSLYHYRISKIKIYS